MVYANDVGHFVKAWQRMLAEFGDTQHAVVACLEATYMPLQKQWANCHIKKLRNFGVRTTSPTEANHHDCKNYLDSSRGDLLKLFLSKERLKKKVSDAYNTTLNQNALSVGRSYQRLWLSDVPLYFSRRAIDLVIQQHRRAERHLVTASNTQPKPIDVCLVNTCSFSQQYGLPYKPDTFEFTPSPPGRQ
ncbi:hypothetical protein Micbo1qcDRAFT_210483 [Microdochium bolleyi]|uniref:Uncharacterized protein n=1 Tax=Microdochium bolleyi TaxID=196109 RepID=A0A136IID9_9PEZI|nr:hypothetical protein Micbo1qcDRAFT_210483 [Microdochium bolleyi]